jgi:hypothetical protein
LTCNESAMLRIPPRGVPPGAAQIQPCERTQGNLSCRRETVAALPKHTTIRSHNIDHRFVRTLHLNRDARR